jgi:hypothetical protein
MKQTLPELQLSLHSRDTKISFIQTQTQTNFFQDFQDFKAAESEEFDDDD